MFTTTQFTPQRIAGITHPMIKDMYLKSDLHSNGRNVNVLVIEAAKHSEPENDHETFDSYLIDLLADLNDLRRQAEEQVGHFDRIDIRSH